MNDSDRKQFHGSFRTTTRRAIYFLIILTCILLACNPFFAGERLPAGPTESQSSTAPEATPESPIFRDDFNGALSSAWMWDNKDASRYKVENGWLEITGGNESILNDEKQTNLLWIALPEGNFEMSTHVKSQPLLDYQRAGLLLYQDSNHYIALSQGYCMRCLPNGKGVFLEYSLAGRRGEYSTAFDGDDLYLMLIVEQGAVSAFYAAKEGQWLHIASLENDIRFERAALNVTNDRTWDRGYDIVGMFDYFEIRRPTRITPTPTRDLFQQT